MLDLAAINQPEINDIDRNLRVVAGFHLFPDQLLNVLIAGIVRQGQLTFRLLAQRIRVLAVDTKQMPLDIDGVAATQCLGDHGIGVFG